MASVVSRPNGRKGIQFADFNGKRQEIRLGKQTEKQAEAIATKVEAILSDVALGRPHDPETAAWLKKLSPAFLRRLERHSLDGGLNHRSKTLGSFLAEYFEKLQTNVKPNTYIAYSQAKRNLLAFFREDCRLRGITPTKAEAWREYLVTTDTKHGKKLAKATVSRRIRTARTIFADARKRKYLEDNPFADVKATDQLNRDRMFFVTRDMIEKVLGACPDAEWRLMVALARFGGVRCPSEIVTLVWSNIDWDAKRITVISPKTAHHPGKETRLIPMFPELEKYLREVLAEAKPGATNVITRYQGKAQNLRTHFQRIIRRAGVKPWPKLWQNLRSTRETELTDSYPLHVVCGWIGNTPKIAQNHYLQVTDDHFARAVAGPKINGFAAANGAKNARKIRRSKPQNRRKMAVNARKAKRQKTP